jgi:D-arabinose 1-dehydrogenase-like Zn-dependent alcohol dehydrogenase
MNHWQENADFKGWLAHNRDAAKGNMEWGFFKPKPWEETDIDIRISYCGICSSDIHVLRSDWASTDYPVVVGHEIVGIAVRVGSEVKSGIEVGDRVGVGAQSDACLCRKPPAVAHDWSNCERCARGEENNCPHISTTYNSHFHSMAAEGAKTMGGYALYHRCPAHFVFQIPEELSSEHAAPLMCAGITVYSALLSAIDRRSERGQLLKGMRIGIVGLGGLGHLAIQFAKAMGADYVLAISRQESKRHDAHALGADDFAVASGENGWAKERWADSLDLIISTATSSGRIAHHLHLLKHGGRYLMLGMPAGAIQVDATLLVIKEIHIAGSLIGSPREMREMLDFAAKQEIKPWVEIRNMRDANKAILDMEAGEARYRLVLHNGKC